MAVLGFSPEGEPVFAKEMRITGALVALLKDAMMPNLVQSAEGVPAILHGGPFANIAHGCNSVLATRMALAHADYAVTEAGFAFDLGGEKFMHIKCRQSGLAPAAIVIVATVRALICRSLMSPLSNADWKTSPRISIAPRCLAGLSSWPSINSRRMLQTSCRPCINSALRAAWPARPRMSSATAAMEHSISLR